MKMMNAEVGFIQQTRANISFKPSPMTDPGDMMMEIPALEMFIQNRDRFL